MSESCLLGTLRFAQPTGVFSAGCDEVSLALSGSRDLGVGLLGTLRFAQPTGVFSAGCDGVSLALSGSWDLVVGLLGTLRFAQPTGGVFGSRVYGMVSRRSRTVGRGL